MTRLEAARRIDISAVRTAHTLSDIQQAVAVAKAYSFINVHSLPCWTKTVRELLLDTPHIFTGAPVGFPGGGHVTKVKLLEAEQLIEDGVQEMDIVMNVGRFKNKEYELVRRELEQVIALAPPEVLTKVIIEINTLTEAETAEACALVMQTGADFLKTGTGWVPAALDLARIRRIREQTRGKLKLKVAGGLRTTGQFEALCAMGVERFGINLHSAREIVEAYGEEPATT